MIIKPVDDGLITKEATGELNDSTDVVVEGVDDRLDESITWDVEGDIIDDLDAEALRAIDDPGDKVAVELAEIEASRELVYFASKEGTGTKLSDILSVIDDPVDIELVKLGVIDVLIEELANTISPGDIPVDGLGDFDAPTDSLVDELGEEENSVESDDNALDVTDDSRDIETE